MNPGLKQAGIHTSHDVRRIELTEWLPRDVVLTEAELQGVLSCPAQIQVQALRNGVYRLRPGSSVGLINLETIQILIIPKCEMPSLLFMLADVYEFASLLPQLSGYEKSSDVVDLLIQMFLAQTATVIRQGLRRTYVTKQDELIVARGRIGMRESSALHFQGRPRLFCTFEEFTLNGVENQLLLAALNQIWKRPLLGVHRRSLARRLAAEFEDVIPQVPGAAQLRRVRRDRLNMHYWPAVGLAELILQQSGLATQFGEVSGNGFLIDMNKLFEAFVCRKLRKALAPLGVTTHSHVREYFDEEKTTSIIPDLCFTAPTGIRLVGDTKYKTGTTAASADLYQMLAYCRIMKIRQGVLITVGNREGIRHNIRDGETVISVIPVDLSCSVDDIDRSIGQLAQWVSDSLNSVSE